MCIDCEKVLELSLFLHVCLSSQILMAFAFMLEWLGNDCLCTHAYIPNGY